jgi:hypothetical protein
VTESTGAAAKTRLVRATSATAQQENISQADLPPLPTTTSVPVNYKDRIRSRGAMLAGRLAHGFALVCAMMSSVCDGASGATKPLNLPLPDPLLAADGSHITTAERWTTEQRPRVLELFRMNMYGRAPVGRPDRMEFQVREDTPSTFGGKARRKLVRITFAGPGGQGHIDTTIYYPTAAAPAGCFVLIDNRTREIIDLAETKPMEFWPVENIVARGYATAAFHYSDTAADRTADNFKSGVFPIFGPTPRTSDAWGALGAWAWGASRVIDLLEAEPALVGKPIAVAGHSRGGKAALWCGAQDPRVALTISNDSGQSGAALTRRKVGETIDVITRVFPYWFAENYRRFADHEADLPVDQHMLLALIAPRLVYVASAHDDTWADPTAEFGACVEAGPVFQLFGLRGVGRPTMPGTNAPRHDGAIGYHVRPGAHNLLLIDWNFYMDFTDRHWKDGAPAIRPPKS